MKHITAYQKKLLYRPAVLALLLFYGIAVSPAQPPEQIAANALNATVLLKMQPDNSQGSGFFVGEGLIATNYHVIKEATKGAVKLVREEETFDIEGTTAIDAERDLAIIKVANLQGTALPLGDSDNVQIGETVYTIGNPRGLEGTFATGNISNIRSEGTRLVRGTVLQFTAPISRGSSGGAVLNSRGEVIGIAFETRDDGQNLNFAIPVNYLKELIAQSGPVKPLVAADSPPARNPFSNLLNLILLSATVFGIIHFLPTVKANSWIAAAGVALGCGVIKVIGIGIMTNPALPKGVALLLTAPPVNDIVHALNCLDCFPKLLVSTIKLPAYIVATAFLLGIANKTVRGFELNGFFNTFLVALLVVVIESVLHSFIPGV